MRCAEILMLRCLREAEAYPEVRRAFAQAPRAQEIGGGRR